MSGKLYGVGVGPGDPELITIKAHRILQSCPVVAYPAPDSGQSFARSIVAEYLSAEQIELPIIVPMRVERFPAAQVYDEASKNIAAHLDAGRDVVVLCEGDPFFYGSFMYVYERLAERYDCEVVPGVSSIMTGAAMSGIPLAARNDVLTILPGPLPDDELRARINAADALVIMKVGRHLARIRTLMGEMNLLDKAVYLERVSLAEQRTMRLADMTDETAPYFSMITIYKGAEPWIDTVNMNVTKYD
ncbi:precorrin-2 C(20)-methyltransferase [Ahrensia kielensis]|uniref:precorrin-2 C(20)-methyltransferase n=1 Tax=Ahrensia kielensis TaxID=76980 RepID=UPI0003757449|nr:precorrin-2 C(20)-methyltransferase [Ahrensia kielensis]